MERIAPERIGRETVNFTSDVRKYDVAYRLLAEERDRRDAAKAGMKSAAMQGRDRRIQTVPVVPPRR